MSHHPAHRLAGSSTPRGPCQGWQIPGPHLLPTEGAEARGRGWPGVRAGSTGHSPEQGRCLLVARGLMQRPDVSPRWGLLEHGPIALATSLAAAPKPGRCWCRRVEPAATVSWSSPRPIEPCALASSSLAHTDPQDCWAQTLLRSRTAPGTPEGGSWVPAAPGSRASPGPRS